jgi:hypothetical protein
MTSIAVKSTAALIFQRYLGHKRDIPGSGQWRMTTEPNSCWWCNKHIYSLVFWTINHGWDEETNVDKHQEENLIRQIEEVNNQFSGFEWN